MFSYLPAATRPLAHWRVHPFFKTQVDRKMAGNIYVQNLTNHKKSETRALPPAEAGIHHATMALRPQRRVVWPRHRQEAEIAFPGSWCVRRGTSRMALILCMCVHARLIKNRSTASPSGAALTQTRQYTGALVFGKKKVAIKPCHAFKIFNMRTLDTAGALLFKFK